VTTTSLAALRKYTEARAAAYREEDVEAAIDLLEEAVAIDSTFALAWRGLATHLRNLRINEERRVEALEAAYRHRDRLTEYERYLVEATYHSDLTRDREKAIAAYEAILRRDPDNSQALNNIGVNYWDQADFEEALTWYRRALLATKGEQSLNIANMAIVHANLGNLDSAAVWYARLDSFPPNMLYEDWRANFLWLIGDEEAFRAELARLREDSPGERGRERAANALRALEILHGKVQSVIEESEQNARDGRARGDADAAVRSLRNVARLRLEVLEDTTGAVELADGLIDWIESDSSSIEDPPLWSLASLLIATGQVERGRALADRSWAEVHEQRRRWFGSERDAWLRFEVARGSGRPEEALEAFRTLPPDTCRPCTQLEIARLFDAMGRADSARAYYESYLETPYNFRIFVDARNLADVHERLGQLSDERGDLENAALHYARFVELWKNADPELQPRVRAAQARLEEIVKERG
jgi:tetratricopeptide (TPR) repeat protein